MNTPSVPLKKTALFDAHQKLGARLVDFGGWNMPVQYSGIVDEHKAVREAAGVFDISHMGEFFVSGDKALAFLNGLLTNNVAKLGESQGQYTLMLNEAGGVIDDLIIYRQAGSDYFLVVNAAKIDEDRTWIEKHLLPGVHFADKSFSYSAVALQGPKAIAIARALFGPGWPEPKRNQITSYSWNCQEILTARTGYTGEDGIEIFFKNEIAENFFFALLEAGKPFGLKPCGLGARDTLRLEACLPLNGNDLSDKRTPLEACLGIFVALDRPDEFIGKKVLLQQKASGLKEKLIAFRLKEKGPPPRPHYPLLRDGVPVGEVTSGAPSPTLGGGIGLAYVRADSAEPGTLLELEIRGSRLPVEVVKKPFYKRPS
ncbi:MAG: glycine cleavage system aminomethyltransferase GcvT [Methylacidiphilales bacterium]|nr:glycine cleavage system aminomethyltransferase GcvT [Candidatus Methylacidiphilales bacterium]